MTKLISLIVIFCFAVYFGVTQFGMSDSWFTMKQAHYAGVFCHYAVFYYLIPMFGYRMAKMAYTRYASMKLA